MSARSFVLNKRRQGNIAVFTLGNSTHVLLHGHLIVQHNGNDLILSSCGWKTVTTKVAINRYLSLINSRFNLYQEDGEWYLKDVTSHARYTFTDGIKLNDF